MVRSRNRSGVDDLALLISCISCYELVCGPPSSTEFMITKTTAVGQDMRGMGSLRVHIALLTCSPSFDTLCHCIKQSIIPQVNICLKRLKPSVLQKILI